MSSTRLLARARPGFPRRQLLQSAYPLRILQSHQPSLAARPLSASSKWFDTPQSRFYDFKDVQKLSAEPEGDRYLIDVREPDELQTTGIIPNAINIPLQSSPDALFLPPQEFEDKFGFVKPETDKEVVFYCKAGVRSRAAAGMAKEAGYTKVGEYSGSWMDWEKNDGKVVKS